MNCHATRAVLDLHTEGRLTPKRAKSVDAHLASCADCRAFARPAVAPAAATAPKDFKARLAASLKAAPKAPEPRTPSLRLWPRDASSVALAAAGLILIAVVIGWSGVPSQKDSAGDELAAGRIP